MSAPTLPERDLQWLYAAVLADLRRMAERAKKYQLAARLSKP